MIFKCKNKKFIYIVALLDLALLASAGLFWWLWGQAWTGLDAQLLDLVYARVVHYGAGPPRSPQIVYVTIDDNSYRQFGARNLDRGEMARVNEALVQLGAAAVAYDVVFAFPTTPEADQRFAASLQQLGTAYLPIALDQQSSGQPFLWGSGPAYERLQAQLRQPHERGTPSALHATRASVQFDPFASVAFKTAHISATHDADGVYRWLSLLIKVDTGYLPALSLQMFLDAMRVPVEALTLAWGQTLTIPAVPGSRLSRDLIIPIDAQGRTRVPYPQIWGQDFPSMSVHRLLTLMEDTDLRGNLQEFFENKFVIIGDVSSVIADAGQTPLDHYVPLVAMHAAFLNALLTQTFLSTWSFWQVIALLGVIALLIGVAALSASSLPLYSVGGLIVLGLLGLSWWQCVYFTLVPLTTVLGSFLWIFGGIVVGLQVATARDQAFIRDTFAKYVSEKVVNELLQHRELLHLGGEERQISVLFSDIANFTTIAEAMADSPAKLVQLLNKYLTAMTTIVLEQGGIIDKYAGDSIMAEFGAPLPIPRHADLAVRTALRMQRRLIELRPQWLAEGFPELHCRVGINTGLMVVGNIGSEQVFNYTVIGDAVNLASRLEGANKHYETGVMISEFTRQDLTPNQFYTRLLGALRVKGRRQAVRIYEVYGEQGDVIPAEDLRFYQAYDTAFDAYLERRFDVAIAHFTVAHEAHPQDRSARAMLAHLKGLDPATLPDDWDGAMTLESK